MTNTWSSGYVTDIDYTYGYYTELNPLRVAPIFLNAGLVFPRIETACELGFGQGLSLNIHAAASGIEWYGTDFNPAQAAFARDLAELSGAHVHEEAFADFCSRSDLPDFDAIGLHGIWSWISDANRAVIVDFIRRKLKPGGVLYVSYNTDPGWASMVPVRDLLAEHIEMQGTQNQGILRNIDDALAFAQRLFDTGTLFGQANPTALERFARLKEQNHHYLAHEYFNADWLPMSFRRMTDWLSDAKMTYACSAHCADHIDSVNLTNDQTAMLREIANPTFRESVRDFMCNTQFRRDYWVRGRRSLLPQDQEALLRDQRVILMPAAADIERKVSGARFVLPLSEAVFDPILEHLDGRKIWSVGDLADKVKEKGINHAQLLQALLILVGKGDLAIVQPEADIEAASPRTKALNTFLMNRARSSNDISWLASPVTGGGHAVGRFEQLFLLCREEGGKTPEDWARFTKAQLDRIGQLVLKDGKTLEGQESLDELTRQAGDFADKRLSMLEAMRIA